MVGGLEEGVNPAVGEKGADRGATMGQEVVLDPHGSGRGFECSHNRT